MTATEDQINHVRLLIADVDADRETVSNQQISDYVDLNGGNVRRAAADALDAIAVSELLVSKVIRTQDLQTDGAKLSAELRARADRLRAQADAEDDKADAWDGFDLAPTMRHPRRRPEHTLQNQVWGL